MTSIKKTVYIMINNKSTNSNQIFQAYKYQQDAFNDYIKNERTNKFEYKFKNGEIVFYIEKFNSEELKLQQNYDDFLTFVREDGSKSIISNNIDKLKGFCGYVNRLTCIP